MLWPPSSFRCVLQHLWFFLSFIVNQPGQNCSGDSEGTGKTSPRAHELAGVHADAGHLPGERSEQNWLGKYSCRENNAEIKRPFGHLLLLSSVFRVAHPGQSQRLLCHVHNGKLWLCFAAVPQRAEETTEGHVEPGAVHKVARQVYTFFQLGEHASVLSGE